MLKAFQCDLEKTCFDVPRLRTMTNAEYLKVGLGTVFPRTATPGTHTHSAR